MIWYCVYVWLLCRGVIAVVVIFLLIGIIHMPDGPFIRPHPVLWRLVLCVSILYILMLIYILFQVCCYVYVLYTYVCMYICVCVWVYVCMLCLFVCMLCMYAWLHVCCVYVCVSRYVHMYVCVVIIMRSLCHFTDGRFCSSAVSPVRSSTWQTHPRTIVCWRLHHLYTQQS